MCFINKTTMAKHFTSVLRVLASSSTPSDAQPLTVEDNTAILPIVEPRPSSASAPQDLSFSYDRIFQSESLASVYKASVKEVVESVLLGYHGTVISFGTVESSAQKSDSLRSSQKGMISKATEQIFRCLKKSKRSRTHTSASNLIVLCSFNIVVNENVHDLLFEYSAQKALPSEINLQSDKEALEIDIPPKLKVVKGGALQTSQHEVKGTVKVASLLQYGTKMERKILETYRLQMSSDTVPPHHTVFTMSVEYAQFGSMNAPVSGNLTFVDLSPSDPLAHRQRHTTGEQVSEQMMSLFSFADRVESLTASNMVIDASSSSGFNFKLDERGILVPQDPQRENAQGSSSTLTQIISDALGGNCNTLMITHIQNLVNLASFPEQFETLKLGSQARWIQNNPNKRDLAEKALMSAYMRGLQEMYGQGVRAKEEELRTERARITLKSSKPLQPLEVEAGNDFLSDSKASILSEDIDTAYDEMIGMTEDEERQRNMEMAATALVAAALKDKEEEEEKERGEKEEDEEEEEVGEDSEDSDLDDDLDSEAVADSSKPHETTTTSDAVEALTNKPTKDSSSPSPPNDNNTSSTRIKKVSIRRKTLSSSTDEADPLLSPDLPPPTEEEEETDITIEALITILQHPDRGVPRPSSDALKHVRVRKDAGDVFSGAAIVKWMIENIEGVENEEDATKLGQLLLERGAIFHTEGSTVFANAESLFYHARDARPMDKALSLEEIQALLVLSRQHTTLVSEEDAGKSKEGGADKTKRTNVTEVAVFDGPDDAPDEEMFVTHSVTDILDDGALNFDPAIGLNQPFPEEENAGRKPHVVSTLSTSSFQSPSKNPQLNDVSNQLHSDGDAIENGGDGVAEMENGYEAYGTGTQNGTYDPVDGPYGMENGYGPTGFADVGIPHVDQEGRMGEGDVPQNHTHEDGTTCEACQQEHQQRVKEMEELLSKQDEDTGEPNTVPQDNLPSIQTLENTQNYPHPLHMAVAIGKSPGVVRQLVMMFGVNKKDEFNRTPLMFAALGNNKAASCTTLIGCGAEVNWQDVSGLTALHVACYHGNKSAVNALLSKKANVTLTDRNGHSAFHWSTIPENHGCLQLLMRLAVPELVKLEDKSSLTAVHWAIYYDHPQHLKLLLKKYDAPLKLDSEGRTLISYAIEQQAVKCMEVLLTAHPELLTLQDCTNASPLHHASVQESHEPLNILLSHKLPKKSSVKLDIDCKNQHDRTPLHCAVAYNRLRNASLLVAHGAQTENIVDNEDRSPMDYARRLGEEMVSVLEGEQLQIDTDNSNGAAPTADKKASPPNSETKSSRVCSLF